MIQCSRTFMRGAGPWWFRHVGVGAILARVYRRRATGCIGVIFLLLALGTGGMVSFTRLALLKVCPASTHFAV